MIAGVTADWEAVRERLAWALRRTARHELRNEEPDVLVECLRRLEAASSAETAGGERLARLGVESRETRVALADLMGLAARELAPDGEPPADPTAAEALRAVLATVHHLYGSGFQLLGRPSIVDEGRFAALVRESRKQPRTEVADNHHIADPGPALRELAVDPRTLAAVSAAVGFRVRSTHRAVYMYLAAPVQVPLHVDHADYEIVVHLTLEHRAPRDGSRRAALVVHRLDGPPVRLPLLPGEALVLRGRGSVHGREALGSGERWSSTAIGFEPYPG